MFAWKEIYNLLKVLEKDIFGSSITVHKPFLIDYSMEIEPDHPFVLQLVAASNRYANNRRGIDTAVMPVN